MFKEILFAPGLYLNEEEITLFGVVWNKDSLPSKEEYKLAIEGKLEKSILKAFENLIQENFADFEMAELISNYTFGRASSLGVEELTVDFQSSLKNVLIDNWAMSSLEAICMDLGTPDVLASQLMDNDYFNGMLSDFYERIEVLKKDESLEEYYLKTDRLEEGESLENIGKAYFDYNNYDLVFADFFELSVHVYENID